MKDYNHFWEVYADASGFWRWRIRSHSRRIVAVSGESFASKRNALRAIKRFAWRMYLRSTYRIHPSYVGRNVISGAL